MLARNADAVHVGGKRGPWLVLLLRPSVTLAYTATDPGDRFTADQREYTVMGPSDVSATFDRIVDSRGRFIGIQVWPVQALAAEVYRSLPRHDYLRVGQQGSYIELYFGSTVDPDSESMGEQSVVGGMYRGGRDEFAVAVDLTALSEAEADLATIRTDGVEWTTIDSSHATS